METLVNFLNSNTTSLVSFCGVLVTLILGVSAIMREKTKMKVEQQKMRPLVNINYFDGEEKMYIYLENKGAGPLLITNYYLQSLNDSKDIKQGIYDCINLNHKYENYSGSQVNTVLSAGKRKALFKMVGKRNDKSHDEVAKNLRQEFKKYKIVVEYKDVYDKKMPKYERSLEWFGRIKGDE